MCWCGSGKKWKKCHYPKAPPDEMRKTLPENFDKLAERYSKRYGIILKTKKQIEGIRRSCALAAKILDATCAMAKEGVTTQELCSFSERLHKEAGALAAPLGYGTPPFPKSICTSLNEVICHGIPNDVPLKNGDICNIDITCVLDGYYGDCSKMVQIGEISEEKKRVCDASYNSLMKSIAILKPGIPLYHIGEVIQSHAESCHCSVVTHFVAHGVGVDFHEPPQIPHYRNSVNIILAPGMTFTIEPMINAGQKEAVIDKDDQWTARTVDGKPSAQYEHTVLITEDGHEILTPWTR